MNLMRLKRSRKQPKVGDIFVFKFLQRPNQFFFGRVIADDTKIGGITEIGVILVYLYAASSERKEAVPPLSRSELLIAPLGTNTVPWRDGYFEVVDSRPLLEEDVLPKHCFKGYGGRYYDEYGNRLDAPIDPCGSFGLSGIAGIDLALSRALGFEQANQSSKEVL